MFPKRTDAYDTNGDSHTGRCPKTRGGERCEFSGGCILILQLEVSGQRTHLIGTSLHPTARKTAAGGQQNTGIGYDVRLMHANAINGGE